MVESLSKLTNSDARYKFFFDCIDDLIGNHREFDNYTGDVQWTQQELLSAVNFVQTMYRVHANKDLINLELKNLDLNEPIKEAMQECYETRREEIMQELGKEAMRKCGKLVVENIDWKLKWILGSSKVANYREPVIQVDLHCLSKEKGGPRETVNFEMNLEQIDKLIADLEIVKKELGK